MSTRQGSIAEKEFELTCLKRSMPVFVPAVDINGIDFIVQTNSKKLLSIQIKSTFKKDSSRNSYKVNVVRGFDGRKYEQGDFDYLVIYIFDISTYYIIPQKIITAKTIRLNPDSNRGKYNIYKEAWHLFK